MENRAQQHHRERLSEALKEEIATIVEGELGDPRIGLVTVSDVHLSPDGKSANVLVSVTGTDEEAKQSLKGLEAAVGYIKHEIVDRLRLRHSPELFFRLDRSEQIESRIEELLKRSKKRAR
jgi:ribosome-binding factor A